jgi:hypothetical protein
MKKMIIAIAVLVALAFTAYFAFQTVDVKAQGNIALKINVDSNGDVVSIQSVSHDGDELCILHHVAKDDCQGTGGHCVWKKVDGYWMCK